MIRALAMAERLVAALRVASSILSRNKYLYLPEVVHILHLFKALLIREISIVGQFKNYVYLYLHLSQLFHQASSKKSIGCFASW